MNKYNEYLYDDLLVLLHVARSKQRDKKITKEQRKVVNFKIKELINAILYRKETYNEQTNGFYTT